MDRLYHCTRAADSAYTQHLQLRILPFLWTLLLLPAMGIPLIYRNSEPQPRCRVPTCELRAILFILACGFLGAYVNLCVFLRPVRIEVALCKATAEQFTFAQGDLCELGECRQGTVPSYYIELRHGCVPVAET
ncbi:uncharacterized protein ARMOST_20158 [Armillaria ostoyae]|uniref:Uncharacterized protein n=1 Tax=Armillaria ostoyae TaxID=47428 RepID=A0A284S6I7_ARMOS|nr:uncharacterized protein ARMOST_20158 [Armillaria ostoyae]